MPEIKTIGVLTSGGDCAGLNAVVRAVTYHAVQVYGWKVVGIQDSTLGLIERPLRYQELRLNTFDGRLLRESGTFLGTTSKDDPLHVRMPDGSIRDRTPDFAEGVRQLGLDALVVIGGDGSMRILSQLCERAQIGMVGVPKTIDNDVHGTDWSVGFSTALSVVTEALDRLQPTAASHHRVMILEVMGRDTGHIALNGGIAGGADVILIPELPYTIDGVMKRIRQTLSEGRSHAMVIIAEGVRTADGEKLSVQHAGGQSSYGGIGHYLATQIAPHTRADVRVTVLGHLQRGGTPSARDRLLASSFGVRAVELVAARCFGRMVAWRDRGVIDVPLSEVTIGARALDPDDPLIRTARGLGIYVGG
ncbi:MAG: ATP-dependent 6-phosphofructokinase [Rhodospirillaceae bacterium]